MTEGVFERHSGEETLAMLDEITDLYAEIHSDARYESSSIFSRPSFIARTKSQVVKRGFELVTVRADGVLAGFSFGHTVPPGSWWQDATPPPNEVLCASKFAVIELDVRGSHREQGFGKRLLQMLLENRNEEFATLATIPNTLAHDMYIRWGWYKVGEFTDEPPMDALLFRLH